MASATLVDTHGCPEPLEKIFRQVEEESERRAEEEQLRAAQRELHLQDEALRKAKARRRGSISISRLGQLSPDDFSQPSPYGSQPTSPKGFSVLASSSPFFKQMTNASTSSIASGASAFSHDDAHKEDPTQVMQVHQIPPKQSIATKIIPRRLSRARSTQMYPTGDSSIIGVSVSETTVHSECTSEEGEETTPSRRASVSAQRSLRSQRSLSTIPEPTSSMTSTWVVTKARELTQKFKRRSRQNPLSPSSTSFPL